MATTKRTLSCVSCKLRDGDVLTPKMQPHGKGHKGILIIGEAPGKVEDRRGLHWQGRSGRLLQRTLKKFDIDLFEDCVCVNAVNCRPPKNRTPSTFEVACCREVVVGSLIEKMKPKVIILLGTSAVQSFLGQRWTTDLGGITKWRGFRIPDQDYRAWVIPAFHPSYVMRVESREANTVWEQDLGQINDALDCRFPVFKAPKIRIIEDLEELRKFKDYDEIAIDYETTGLKAQRKGQRIICAGLAASDKEVYAFMMPRTKAGRRPFLELLEDPTVGKIAHNIKYEHNWTKERLGVEVQNWQWDSMQAAHLLDNRASITGLKFQTYMNFGTLIKDEAGEYLYNKSETDVGMNRVYELLEQEEGETKILKHVALDAYYEYLLAKKQMKELNYQYLPF